MTLPPNLRLVADERDQRLATTPELIEEFRAGRMIILVDEEDRENEGDLVVAAEHVTPEIINFMARHARGLICLTLTPERCAQLDLPLMTQDNRSNFGTNFTVSIEAAEGVSSGISAADRARTIRVAIAPDARPSDLVRPGHVFPVMAQPGGVLTRAGHTEAGCDLARLAGLTPAAVICEIMKDDGTMARLPDLFEFAREHGLKIGTIRDLIHYRAAREVLVEAIGQRRITTVYGPMMLWLFREKLSTAVHVVLVKGEPEPDRETLVRVHEPLSLVDLIEVDSAVHSWSLDAALRRIAQAEAGVVVLLTSVESPDRLIERALHPRPLNAHRTDLRTYGIGAQILRAVGVGKMRVLARPRRTPSVAGFGLEIVGFEAP
ncbi:MAG: bifunctional 3,4-dihydroxy-2-butanone-4-phosphate synthase/GTP cyclohydrolase II [Casimicrobiaceae bacterium]|nr:bifunctional 3,4-dihydroxy-2-butanone-4-phosphate synthase/GTP cyclohydrolase II [Casimicrobiaceae bacterium]MCX8098877.1 bifunctional 3,4-dihydroxy-2-butanone-4-phosphate synthase/GTP cyclohydrolase II [Casimicrobiaceae bacterium]MDW8312983.1 bifunctional 3,4-dihydroxy-2-butanone-4-phosphate synthase/GTP cyclohydrolase II [Burkholderiales bacterium]